MATRPVDPFSINVGSVRPFTCPDCGGHNWHPNDDLTLRCITCGWNTK